MMHGEVMYSPGLQVLQGAQIRSNVVVQLAEM